MLEPRCLERVRQANGFIKKPFARRLGYGTGGEVHHFRTLKVYIIEILKG